MIRIDVPDPEMAKKVANGGAALRDLCRIEVENFSAYLRSNEAGWQDGLAEWESQILKTFLYQKIRGRVDAATAADNLFEERADG